MRGWERERHSETLRIKVAALSWNVTGEPNTDITQWLLRVYNFLRGTHMALSYYMLTLTCARLRYATFSKMWDLIPRYRQVSLPRVWFVLYRSYSKLTLRNVYLSSFTFCCSMILSLLRFILLMFTLKVGWFASLALFPLVSVLVTQDFACEFGHFNNQPRPMSMPKLA